MPRIRTIKPELPSDEKLASVSRDARLTFIYLITQADDDGLVAGRPRQLLGQLFPGDEDVDDDKLSRWLRELTDIGLARWRETVDGAPVVELVNWDRHQKVDHKGRSLLLPRLAPFASVSRESREDGATVSRSDLGPRIMDHGPADAITATGKAPRQAPSSPDGFADFWSVYPKRSGGASRSDAEAAWTARRREGVAAFDMIEGARRYAAFALTTGKIGTEYVKQPKTFLGRGRHWEEAWEAPASAADAELVALAAAARPEAYANAGAVRAMATGAAS